jgi:hypothetical protein
LGAKIANPDEFLTLGDLIANLEQVLAASRECE